MTATWTRIVLGAGLVSAMLVGLHRHLPVVEAQTFPLTVKLGIVPDTSANPPLGYTTALDGAAAVDQGLPATTTCTALVGGAQFSCLSFSVVIAAAGTHTVNFVAYNIAGNSTPTPFTFIVTTSPPSTPSGVKIIR